MTIVISKYFSYMLCPMVATFRESFVYSCAAKLFLKMVSMGQKM
jgi:hypothetical protein